MILYFGYILVVCTTVTHFTIFCNADEINFNERMLLTMQPYSVFGRNGFTQPFITENWQEINISKNDFRNGGISSKCMAHLDDFSFVTSKFINCAVTNSRPLHYCKNCVSEFVSVQNAFARISNDSGGVHSNCREQILRADTIQLALVTYNFVESIWKSSDCAKCFDLPILNTSQPTVMTKTLLQKINDTLECFKDFSFINRNGSSNVNNSVCGKCRDFYFEASNFYEVVENENKLCSDLIDSMNYTRLAWAGKYHCTIALKDNGVVWVITILVCLLPIVLYIGLVFYEKRYAARSSSYIGRDDCQGFESSE